MSDGLLTVQEVAALLEIGQGSVGTLVNRLKLHPAEGRGMHARFTPAAVERYRQERAESRRRQQPPVLGSPRSAQRLGGRSGNPRNAEVSGPARSSRAHGTLGAEGGVMELTPEARLALVVRERVAQIRVVQAEQLVEQLETRYVEEDWTQPAAMAYTAADENAERMHREHRESLAALIAALGPTANVRFPQWLEMTQEEIDLAVQRELTSDST